MSAIAHLNHESLNILNTLKMTQNFWSDLGHFNCALQEITCICTGVQGAMEPAHQRVEAKRRQCHRVQPGHKNWRFSQNFSVKTFSPEGTAGLGVGGSWKEELSVGGNYGSCTRQIIKQIITADSTQVEELSTRCGQFHNRNKGNSMKFKARKHASRF